jgi:hypothetical protein
MPLLNCHEYTNQAQNGRTALMWAAYKDKSEFVSAFVAAGADLNAQDNVSQAPFILSRVFASFAWFKHVVTVTFARLWKESRYENIELDMFEARSFTS